jgi:hypothetical protein
MGFLVFVILRSRHLPSRLKRSAFLLVLIAATALYKAYYVWAGK